MRRAVRVSFLILWGLGFAVMIAGLCDSVLGSPFYGFVLVPVLFGLLARKVKMPGW